MLGRPSHAHRFTAAVFGTGNGLPAVVKSPFALLAISVVGCAVDDARNGERVTILPDWLDLADVSTALVASEGIEVAL